MNPVTFISPNSKRSLYLGLLLNLTIASMLTGQGRGVSFEQMVGKDGIITETDYDVIVATVTKVSDHQPTNHQPPRIEIQTNEILRGELAPQRTRAVLNSFDPYSFCAGDEEIKKRQAWLQQPVAKRKVNEQLILVGSLQKLANEKESWFVVSGVGLRPATNPNRRWALDSIEKRKKYKAESDETTRIWPHHFKNFIEAADDPRTKFLDFSNLEPESETRSVNLGEPVHGRALTGQVWQGHVVKIIDDDSIRVRPVQYDSRFELVLPRKNIRLYPKWFLDKPPRLNGRPIKKTIGELVREAELIIRTAPRNTGIFSTAEVLKGQLPNSTSTPFGFAVTPIPWDVSCLIDPPNKSYLLFLKRGKIETFHGHQAFDIIRNGRAIFVADNDIIATTKRILSDNQ